MYRENDLEDRRPYYDYVEKTKERPLTARGKAGLALLVISVPIVTLGRWILGLSPTAFTVGAAMVVLGELMLIPAWFFLRPRSDAERPEIRIPRIFRE